MPATLTAPPPLPAFVAPMLAQPGSPFDSHEHLFEIKWDGTRMLAFVDGDGSPRSGFTFVCGER